MLPLDPKYLQRLVESSPDIIIAVDREGTITYYNDGARQNLGFDANEVIGQPCTRIYPTIEEARAVMKAMRESATPGRISNYETRFLNKPGEIIPIWISGSLIHDDSENEIGSIGYARDIRRIRQREQLATAGEIAVSLAHEINNPLESMINNLELVARCAEPHLSESEKVVENERLDSIRASIARVQGIVRRLDEMTRKGVYETRDYLAGKRMADLSPRDQPRAIVRDHEPAAPQSQIAGLSVLVLDDDLTVVTSLDACLQRARDSAQCQSRCGHFRRGDAGDGRVRVLPAR
jgi:PAS domain S-box-containing protein